jgi:hypothetical protein
VREVDMTRLKPLLQALARFIGVNEDKERPESVETWQPGQTKCANLVT